MKIIDAMTSSDLLIFRKISGNFPTIPDKYKISGKFATLLVTPTIIFWGIIILQQLNYLLTYSLDG